MILPDVNVLVAACVAQHSDHAVARAFLADARSSGLLVPDVVWSGFVRVTTNRRVFNAPLTIEQAVSFARAVMAAPGYRGVSGLVDGIDGFLTLCIESRTTGNLVSDAYIASVALAHGCPVATFDRDFSRFEGVQVMMPA